MNPLHDYIYPPQMVSTYKDLRLKLKVDELIFESMTQIAQRRNFPFTSPTTPAQYARKHEEVEGMLARFQNVLGRRGLFLELVEELYLRLQLQGMQMLGDELLTLATIPVNNEFQIRLTADVAWAVEWEFLWEGSGIRQSLSNVVYKNNWGPIVPWDVVQYLRSGILLFRQRAYATSLALMSIAVEATLRDVLSTKGYTFNHQANRTTIYQTTNAHVDVNGNSYTVTIADTVPRPPADLTTSSKGNLPIDIKIRRKGNELAIHCPAFLIDHWSSNSVEKVAVTKNIGGLGEALRIARQVENVIDPADLPTDMDDVLKAIRNNLIHFSSNSMNTELPRFASRSPIGRFTLKDFVKDTELVFDLVTEIPRFVNEQYVKLWRAGVHVP